MYIEGAARNQIILFPEKVDDYIGEDNPVQFIDAFVDSLDLRVLGFKRAQSGETSRPPYHPADMVKLYLWGYLNRVRSSRSLERESHRNLEVMWLLKKLTPDFKTIADFRKDNKEALKKLCGEFTLLCKRLELFGGELVAIDSSKFRAVNCKKRNFNRAKLEKRIKEIKVKMRQWLSEHPFGTMKRGFNQGYLLLKGLARVGAEISLTILSYNVKRAINILGLGALISALRQCPATSPSL